MFEQRRVLWYESVVFLYTVFFYILLREVDTYFDWAATLECVWRAIPLDVDEFFRFAFMPVVCYPGFGRRIVLDLLILVFCHHRYPLPVAHAFNMLVNDGIVKWWTKCKTKVRYFKMIGYWCYMPGLQILYNNVRNTHIYKRQYSPTFKTQYTTLRWLSSSFRQTALPSQNKAGLKCHTNYHFRIIHVYS